MRTSGFDPERIRFKKIIFVTVTGTTIRGLEIIWTCAETKHWRQQENLQSFSDEGKNLKLSRFITELSVVVGPTDFVVDLDVVTMLAKVGNLMTTKAAKRAPKSQSKMPLLNIQLQDTVFFYPVEKYERLVTGFKNIAQGTEICIHLNANLIYDDLPVFF